MALISPTDSLCNSFMEFFANFEKQMIGDMKMAGLKAGGPPVAVGSTAKSNQKASAEKCFAQVFAECDDLRNSDCAKLAMKYFPTVIGVAKGIMPIVTKSQLGSSLLPILHNLGIIGIGLAAFAGLVLLKYVIEQDCASTGAEAKELIQRSLEFVETRVKRNDKRFDEIASLILKIKLAQIDNDSNLSKLIVELEHNVRLCKIDIVECLQKTDELYAEIESTILAFEKKLKISAAAAAGFGVIAVAGTAAAIVATGGLAIFAGVAAGVTGVATGGFGYHSKLCSDGKYEFLRMKGKCDSFRSDIKMQKEKLKKHVKHCQENNISLDFSLNDLE